MAADIKSLRVRIKSVSSTQHLTKAMGLVASSKIRKANLNMAKSAQYSNTVLETINELTACRECQKSPYMKEGGDRLRLIVIAGDRGLAGGYNANIFRLMKEYPNAEVIPIAIMDGVIYIKGTHKLYRYLENHEDQIIISSLLLREFLYSL